MATLFSVLAWRIPWTEEPGGLQSTGMQKVGHSWSNWARIAHTTFYQCKQYPLTWLEKCDSLHMQIRDKFFNIMLSDGSQGKWCRAHNLVWSSRRGHYSRYLVTCGSRGRLLMVRKRRLWAEMEEFYIWIMEVMKKLCTHQNTLNCALHKGSYNCI